MSYLVFKKCPKDGDSEMGISVSESKMWEVSVLFAAMIFLFGSLLNKYQIQLYGNVTKLYSNNAYTFQFLLKNIFKVNETFKVSSLMQFKIFNSSKNHYANRKKTLQFGCYSACVHSNEMREMFYRFWQLQWKYALH